MELKNESNNTMATVLILTIIFIILILLAALEFYRAPTMPDNYED